MCCPQRPSCLLLFNHNSRACPHAVQGQRQPHTPGMGGAGQLGKPVAGGQLWAHLHRPSVYIALAGNPPVRHIHRGTQRSHRDAALLLLPAAGYQQRVATDCKGKRAAGRARAALAQTACQGSCGVLDDCGPAGCCQASIHGSFLYAKLAVSHLGSVLSTADVMLGSQVPGCRHRYRGHKEEGGFHARHAAGTQHAAAPGTGKHHK